MSELSDFRKEVRAVIEEQAPRSLFNSAAFSPFVGYWGGRKAGSVEPDVLAWRDLALEHGWTAPTWPKEYGGGGFSEEQAVIIDQERRRRGLPYPVVGFGLAMIGPTLLQYGTEEQRQEHLPAIVRGDIRWCQGYSEPNAGSDLASLQMKGELDGDDFIVNGQKIWTSHADESDWIFCLVRTDPHAKRKQSGISFMLVDMETPGVSVKKIELISGASPFCETFFDNVRVPVKNVVNGVNNGWSVAKALLGHERATIGRAFGGGSGTAQRELVERARKHLDTSTGPIPDPLLRDAIAAVGMDEEALELTISRIRQESESGAPGPESSIIKIVATELKQRRFEVGMRAAGEQGLGWEGPGFEEDDLEYTREWLRSRANTIEGGTSEVQLNIIAKRVLGLPS